MNLGEVKLTVLLDVIQAEKNAGKLTASLKDLKVENTKVTAASKDLGTQSVTLKGKLQNLGLAVDGIRAGFSVLRYTFGDFISSYQQAEIANAKLANGLKNVGEGLDSVNRLTQQASELQKITVYKI